jgi:hypothetical protein
MSSRSPSRLWLLAIALALTVQGCREEEQNRPLVHQKGSYQGPVDEKLDQEQIDALRQRAAGQAL